MKKVTAFKRLKKGKWVHNHIEDGHKCKPEVVDLERYKFEQGYLIGKKNTFIAV